MCLPRLQKHEVGSHAMTATIPDSETFRNARSLQQVHLLQANFVSNVKVPNCACEKCMVSLFGSEFHSDK
jgi:hypothetical protein